MFPMAEVQRVRFSPTVPLRAASAYSPSTIAEGPVAVRVSGTHPGPSTMLTSLVNSALSLAIHVTWGGGPSTKVGTRASRVTLAARFQTSSIDIYG